MHLIGSCQINLIAAQVYADGGRGDEIHWHIGLNRHDLRSPTLGIEGINVMVGGRWMVKFADLLPDSKMQKEYESALGEFLVAFNDLENWVRVAIEFYLREKNLNSVWQNVRQFNFAKLVKLYQSMAEESEDMPRLDVKRCKEFGEERNKFAHAHYIMGPRKNGVNIVTKSGPVQVDIAKMKINSEDIRQFVTELWSELGSIMFPQRDFE